MIQLLIFSPWPNGKPPPGVQLFREPRPQHVRRKDRLELHLDGRTHRRPNVSATFPQRSLRNSKATVSH
jgi:hypothetical protein